MYESGLKALAIVGSSHEAILGFAFVALGVWALPRILRPGDQSLERRLLAGLVPLALLAVCSRCVSVVLQAPNWDWNACRLAPAVAYFRGYDLYFGPTSGPIVSTVYGPVASLLLAPCAVFPEPTGAILMASAITLAAFAGPLLWAHFRAAGVAPISWNRIMGAFAVAFLGAASLRSTSYMLGSVHVDAIAVGLGLLSCFPLIQKRRAIRDSDLALAATLAALAVSTKQIAIPIGLAHSLFLGLAYGGRKALRYLVALLGAGLALLVTYSVFFDIEKMWFNMFVLLSKHPLKGGGSALALLADSFLELMTQSGPWILLCVVSGLTIWRSRSAQERDPRLWLRAQLWLLVGLVGVVLLPTSTLGNIKAGGGQNSYHSVYFLVSAASLALLRLSGYAPEGDPRGQPRRKLATRALITLLVLLGAMTFRRQLEINHMQWLLANPQREAYQFAKGHPNEAYFPWNPLSSLMADGKLYHFELAVVDRRIGGFDPSDEHVRANLPSDLRYVAFHSARQSEGMLSYLPEFTRRVDLPDLPDWIVYGRE